MSSKKQKIIKITTEGLKDNYIENYSDALLNWTPQMFDKMTEIEIKSKTDEELVFDIKGVDPTIVNTLRRIMIAEIPTMAIETVIVNQNTSIIPDEVFAHRLGLVPILADANDFIERKPEDDFNDKNSIKFTLNIKCYKDKNGQIINENIYTKDLVFEPQGDQEKKYYNSQTKKYSIGLVHDDILLNKLIPGMEIDLECYCEKGIGRTHAKWSPVCTAYYRLANKINILKEIKGDDAEELRQLCPKGVFIVNKKGNAEVGNIRECTMCRECIRQKKFTDLIELGKIADHYEFHIESVGMYTPESIFFRAIDVLKNKINIWHELLKEKAKEKK
jgi:DNA-directed RNA polymerase I and III subunit RPAC1